MKATDLIDKTFQVLDSGYVKLYNAMPIDELMEDYCAEISRLSYGGERKQDNDQLWRKLCKLGGAHIKALEWITFDLEIRAPVVVWWHLDTYRLRSYYSKSLRRIEPSSQPFYVPEDAPEAERRIIEELYNLADLAYNNLRAIGTKKERARLVLPFGTYYTRRCKFDGKALLRLLQQRTQPDTQFETRQYAAAVLKHIYAPLLPTTADCYFPDHLLD